MARGKKKNTLYMATNNCNAIAFSGAKEDT